MAEEHFGLSPTWKSDETEPEENGDDSHSSRATQRTSNYVYRPDDLAHAQDTFRMAQEWCNKQPIFLTLLYDELTFVITERPLHPSILNTIVEALCDNLEPYFMDNITPDMLSAISNNEVRMQQELWANLGEKATDKALKILPFIIGAGKELEMGHSHEQLWNLFALFRLLQTCLRCKDGNIEILEVFAGCSVVMFPSNLRIVQNFEELSEPQKDVICFALFAFINWFRELLNAFCKYTPGSADAIPLESMRTIVIFRLKELVRIEKVLDQLLEKHSAFTLPIEDQLISIGYNKQPARGRGRSNSGTKSQSAKSKTKTKKKSATESSKSKKKRAEIEEENDNPDGEYDQQEEGADDDNSTTRGKTLDVPGKCSLTPAMHNLALLRPFMRELVPEVNHILFYIVDEIEEESEMASQQHKARRHKLDPSSFWYLIQDMNDKLQMLANSQKRTAWGASPSHSLACRLHPYAVLSSILPALGPICVHLEYFKQCIQKEFGRSAEDSSQTENHVIMVDYQPPTHGDHSLHETIDESYFLLPCYASTFDCFMHVLSLDELRRDKTVLVDRVLRTFTLASGYIPEDDSSIGSASSSTRQFGAGMFMKSFVYLEQFADGLPTMDASLKVLHVLCAIADISEKCKGKLNSRASELAKRLLTNESFLIKSIGTSLCQLLREYICRSEDPIQSLHNVCILLKLSRFDGVDESQDKQDEDGEEDADREDDDDDDDNEHSRENTMALASEWPSLEKLAFPSYYRTGLEETVQLLRELVPKCVSVLRQETHDDNEEEDELRELIVLPISVPQLLKQLRSIVGIFHRLIRIASKLDKKPVLSSVLRNGRVFLELFLKIMPFLGKHFQQHTGTIVNDVINPLEMKAIRHLRELCAALKAIGGTSLTDLIPSFMKVSEQYLLQVSKLVRENKASDSLWVSSVRHKRPHEEDSDDEEQEENEDDRPQPKKRKQGMKRVPKKLSKRMAPKEEEEMDEQDDLEEEEEEEE